MKRKIQTQSISQIAKSKWSGLIGVLSFICAFEGAHAQSGSQQIGDLPVIEIRHLGCPRCAQFDLSFFAGGKVEFRGRALVRELGVATRQLSKDDIADLLARLERLNFQSLASRYARPIGDAADYEITQRTGGQTKTVTFNDISTNPGGELFKFVLFADSLADVRRWVCPAPRFDKTICGDSMWKAPPNY